MALWIFFEMIISLSPLAARVLRKRGNTLTRTFLMDLAGVITSNCFRFLRNGIELTMILVGAKTITCRYSFIFFLRKHAILSCLYEMSHINHARLSSWGEVTPLATWTYSHEVGQILVDSSSYITWILSLVAFLGQWAIRICCEYLMSIYGCHYFSSVFVARRESHQIE